jgi:hypothetical protein
MPKDNWEEWKLCLSDYLKNLVLRHIITVEHSWLETQKLTTDMIASAAFASSSSFKRLLFIKRSQAVMLPSSAFRLQETNSDMSPCCPFPIHDDPTTLPIGIPPTRHCQLSSSIMFHIGQEASPIVAMLDRELDQMLDRELDQMLVYKMPVGNISGRYTTSSHISLRPVGS